MEDQKMNKNTSIYWGAYLKINLQIFEIDPVYDLSWPVKSS